ncbi:histidine kinase [Candidatus Ozemobacteraceae bacterium]|nr:histidine kinase [Candidatus Ozemobacteraceae bacterium]
MPRLCHSGRPVRRPPMVPITIHVSLAAPLPRGSAVFLAGNLPALGDWKPDRVKLERIDRMRYECRFAAPAGTVAEFKVTRGSWKTQAVYAETPDNIPPDNRAFRVEGPACEFETCVADWMDKLPAEIDPVRGDVRAHPGMTGDGLAYPRDIIVWLPPSYRNGRKRYPVLYMHDGQNLFDPATSFCGQDWKLDETAMRLMTEGSIEEFIIVGIANTPDRMEEYNLFRPKGEAYARFLTEVVKPFIDAAYRTKPGREYTAVGGSSMGGLFSFQLGWLRSDAFSMAACLSPAFWFNRGRMFKLAGEGTLPPDPVRFYLDAGDLEPPIWRGFHRMTNILERRGFKDGRDLCSFPDVGAVHSEAAWAARLDKPLTFFFGTSRRGVK